MNGLSTGFGKEIKLSNGKILNNVGKYTNVFMVFALFLLIFLCLEWPNFKLPPTLTTVTTFH